MITTANGLKKIELTDKLITTMPSVFNDNADIVDSLITNFNSKAQSAIIGSTAPTNGYILSYNNGLTWIANSGGGGGGASNLVNGTGTGSLRSSESAVEEKGYTVADYAVSLGNGSSASGIGSIATGSFTLAQGSNSNASGYSSIATGDYSHAEGESTTASNEASHAEGYNTTASGKFSHAEGRGSTASALGSHAGGDWSEASGFLGFAHGKECQALNSCSIAMGQTVKTAPNGAIEGQTIFGRYGTMNSDSQFAVASGSYDGSTITEKLILDLKSNGSLYVSKYITGMGTTAPTSGQVLSYDGFKMVWTDLSSGASVTSNSTPVASEIGYDNSTSGMSATNVQSAIDEVFQSVSNAQNAYETAITDKGGVVSKSGTVATKSEIIAGINSIPSGLSITSSTKIDTTTDGKIVTGNTIFFKGTGESTDILFDSDDVSYTLQKFGDNGFKTETKTTSSKTALTISDNSYYIFTFPIETTMEFYGGTPICYILH